MENITLEVDKIAQVLKEAMRSESTPHPKLQRVAHHIQNREHLAKYYLPRLVSFGPIHHGEPNLQLGEKYKLMWTAMYVEDPHNGKNLYQKIANNIKELKLLYTQDALRHFSDESLAKMLFFDGCSLLQIMGKKSEELKVNDNQLILVHQDMLLLENQLPFQVLQLLSDDNEANLMKTMNEFLRYRQEVSQLVQNEEHAVMDIDDSPPPRPPPHLLHHLRQKMLLDFRPMPRFYEVPKYRNIKDLRAAGIRVKQSDDRRQLEINFSRNLFGGELRIPWIKVDNNSAPIYLNLIAYEMCPDFENNFEISSYVQFLNSLIGHSYDVKELRLAGILSNALGSDEDVAKLFNIIAADLIPDTKVYAHIRWEIGEYYYQRKRRIWLVKAYNTYFKSSSTTIATVAAVLALVLTFIQTWFAIHPSK